MGRVCILGLDGLSPNLLFVDYWRDLPNFRRLAQRSRWGPLRSCSPPITVPAWACLTTGLDPGALGCYGFHDRADHSYGRHRLASSLSFSQPPIWTLLSAAGRRCQVVGVPQTYPAKPLNGTLIAGALTPSFDVPYSTYPPAMAQWLQAHKPSYACDVANFRHLDPATLVAAAQRLTAGTFAIVDHWLKEDNWDFLMAVDMGADRLQHGVWDLCRPEHPAYVPGHPQAGALLAYYRRLDAHVGATMAALRPTDSLWVVSDHGAQAMVGGFALNDWLVATGRLVLRADVARPPGLWALAPHHVDWPQTTAWADGGYVGRIYLNVVGREPAGRVTPAAIEATLARLRADIAALPNPDGAPYQTWRPQERFGHVRGIPPDLVVELAGLKRRALGTLGHATWWPSGNDRGHDAANHGQNGIYLMTSPDRGFKPATLYDVAPSVLTALGVAVPKAMGGHILTASPP